MPSTSGRAVLTLPILIPVSDLLGLSRQTTVLAYQYGPGLVGQFSPTEGALMAILALAGIRYEDWLRFALPLCGLLMALTLAAIAGSFAGKAISDKVSATTLTRSFAALLLVVAVYVTVQASMAL